MNTAAVRGPRRQGSPVMRAFSVCAVSAAVLAGVGVWNAVSPLPGSGDETGLAPISVFTLVSTGIVFIEPDSSDIIWRNSVGDERMIGENPWSDQRKARPSEPTGAPAWQDGRDIVGNPAYDLVCWVETSGRRRGDLVVVRASTGEVLARTAVPAPQDLSVVIASVDQKTVYFATPDPTTGFPDVPGPTIHIWDWAHGESPRFLSVGRTSWYYNDVSAGIWAVYGRGVEFEDKIRRSLAATPYSGSGRTDFGSALSPDGAYWYGVGNSQIVETATGHVVASPNAFGRNYGWTGRAELTLTSPTTVCSAVTGLCGTPVGLPPGGVCTFYGIVCGNHLPVN